jgi:hypothetical protein
MEHEHKLSVRNLYPLLNDVELTEMEQELNQYLALILRIFERIESERYPQRDPLTENNGTLGCTPPKLGSST